MTNVPADPVDSELALRTVASDGSATVHLGTLLDPKWSPVASELEGVTASGDVVVVRADGSHRRVVVTGNAHQVSWSTDGRSLLVTRGEYDGSDDSTVWLVPGGRIGRPRELPSSARGTGPMR